MINRGRRIGLQSAYDKPAYGTAILNPYHPFSRDLVGQWLANEGAGNIAYDTSGQGNHGTLTNGAYWAGSQLGEGINFDGVNDWVSLPLSIPGDYLSWNMNYSVETWIQINNTSTEQNVLVYSGGSTNRAGIIIRGDTIGAGTYNGTTEVNASGPISTGLHHIVATNTSANAMAMYIDGSLQTEATANSWQDNNVCGISFTASPFNGSAIFLRFYKRVLSPTEVKQHYNDPFGNLMHVPLSLFLAGTPSPETEINKQISAGSDDCSEYDDSSCSLDDQTMLVGYNSATFDAGLRWQSVNIPNASTIDSATLSIYISAVGGSLSTDITGIDEDDTATWSAGSRPSQRARTTAKVTANAANWGNYGAGKWATIDITSIVQEIVDRAGWVANNDLAIAIDDTAGSGTNYMSMRCYEYAGNVSGAKLDVVYGTPPTGAAIMNQFQNYNIGADLYNGGIIV